MKQLKDYLHLYIGCDMMDITTGEIYPLYPEIIYTAIEDGDKPLLRKLSDMTEEERNELGEIHFVESLHGDFSTYAAITNNLLSKHFDLFGLIEAGLSIDKKTLK